MQKKSRVQSAFQSLILGSLASGSLSLHYGAGQPLQAAITTAYCQFEPEAAASKSHLLEASLTGGADTEQAYKNIVAEHSRILRQCRSQTWPTNQAIWLRLYPCDVRPGSIEGVLDRVVNLGYNQIYLEVFFDSQVLLPPADNPTPWLSVVRSAGDEKVDLLARAIELGKERGLKVYAWMFTLNFGYAYAGLADRQEALALNGKGENSTSFVEDRSQTFIDPYSRQAQTDYYQLVQAVIRRRPDGVLFDYVRYPRGSGTQSVASKVKDLWIYGNASRQALYQRAKNQKARVLIEKFVTQGDITVADVVALDKLYPQEKLPLWQGRTPAAKEAVAPARIRQELWRSQLWHLSVAHAVQGILNFLDFVALPFQTQKIPTGVVFFPDGNRTVASSGFDSRLQPWNKFPHSMEWHPMAYAVCGNPECVVEEIERVIAASKNALVVPALAGIWGKVYQNHPPLEVQMQAIRAAIPQINSLSHFAYSWQEPEYDHQRRFCKLE